MFKNAPVSYPGYVVYNIYGVIDPGLKLNPGRGFHVYEAR